MNGHKAALALKLSGILILVTAVVLGGRPVWEPQATHVHEGPMLHDLLHGGPQAAVAAETVAAAVRGRPAERVQRMRPEATPRVFTRDGRTVREYTLEIVERTIDYGGGNTWTVWTYNGMVPGPTLRGRVGEILRVRVINRHNRTHSFHAHLTNYPFEMDGSPANIIMQRGAGGMIPPGREFTYEFLLDTAGATYYHCHAGDREFPINQHILQGLYGMIIVEDPRAPAVRDEVLFMAETTRLRRGTVPPFIMNGMGVPGGELALKEIFEREGLPGVTGQLGKTVPFFNMRVGETMHLHVVNIGNIYHSFHAHEIPHVSLAVLGGRPWPAQVVPLLPGAMDTLQIRFRHPGLWLFHCHVVAHADAGQIGVFVVEPRR